MKKGRSILKIVAISLACMVILGLAMKDYVLTAMGEFLIVSHEPKAADVIVVLNGRDIERSLAAVDLYKKGYGKLIILARGYNDGGSREFFERVGEKWNRKIFFQRAVEAMGVPEDGFRLVGKGASSTYEEALRAKEFIQNNGYKSMLLVTSKWHSRRVCYTFRSVFNDNGAVRIAVCPSEYDTFSAYGWWRTEQSTEDVLREYARLCFYLCTFRIKPY